MGKMKLMIGLASLSLILLANALQSDLKVGDEIPKSNLNMKNTSVGESQLSLDEAMASRGLVVVFSCNTCPFVIGNDDFKGWERQYNELAALAEKHQMGFVLVNSNEAKREKGDAFKDMTNRASKQSYTMPYLYDENHVLADAFGAKTTPHVYVFDNASKLLYKGAIDNTYKPNVEASNAEHYLKNMLNNYATGATITPDVTAPKGCSIKRNS